jgi:hypothetical protein
MIFPMSDVVYINLLDKSGSLCSIIHCSTL